MIKKVVNSALSWENLFPYSLKYSEKPMEHSWNMEEKVRFRFKYTSENPIKENISPKYSQISDCCRGILGYMKPHLWASSAKINTGILAITDGKFT